MDQLRANFEEELERQQQIFEVQLIAKQQSSVRIFQELLILEFDKILHSIYHKSVNGTGGTQAELEAKRSQINKVIADILIRNDDRKDYQMKQSLEAIKKKISEVLRVFKAELESKLNRKQDQVVREKVEERLRSAAQNISDIVSVQQTTNHQNEGDGESSRPRHTYSEQFSDDSVSIAPTPRQLDMQAVRSTQDFAKYLNTSADKEGIQLSDIKRYA